MHPEKILETALPNWDKGEDIAAATAKILIRQRIFFVNLDRSRR
jgi:hypothetical protein